MNSRRFTNYVDRIYIINLPERTDRRQEILGELTYLGFDSADPRIEIPFAPRPSDANQFPSKGVYGNFLSHLGILRDARDHGYERILVLEDDAIFSKRMVDRQGELIRHLESTHWDLCFMGHSLKAEIADAPLGPVTTRAEFKWMHCFMVQSCIYDRVIRYFEECLERPPGDALGGRMYIDGAYNMFRRLNADVVTIVTKPAWSLQRGGVSSLGRRRWYDDIGVFASLIKSLRDMRDDAWRRLG